ncbi:MAG: hypothetical protein LBF33_01740 [Oscillospiraceae bacterium]|nr:hypothetical protein [Oscillospiraceae bacterium]
MEKKTRLKKLTKVLTALMLSGFIPATDLHVDLASKVASAAPPKLSPKVAAELAKRKAAAEKAAAARAAAPAPAPQPALAPATPAPTEIPPAAAPPPVALPPDQVEIFPAPVQAPPPPAPAPAPAAPFPQLAPALPLPASVKSTDKAELENLRQKADELSQDLLAKNEEIAALKAQKEQTRSKLKAKLHEVRKSFVDLQQKASEAKSELESELVRKSSETEKLRRALEELKTTLGGEENARRQNEERLTSDLASCKKEMEKLHSECALLKSKNTDLEQALIEKGKEFELFKSGSETKFAAILAERDRLLEQASEPKSSLSKASGIPTEPQLGQTFPLTCMVKSGTSVFEMESSGNITSHSGWLYTENHEVEVSEIVFDGHEQFARVADYYGQKRFVKVEDIFVRYGNLGSKDRRISELVESRNYLDFFIRYSKIRGVVLDRSQIENPPAPTFDTIDGYLCLGVRALHDVENLRNNVTELIQSRTNLQYEVQQLKSELSNLKQGRLAELKYMRQRSRVKIEKLKALHQTEINALARLFNTNVPADPAVSQTT